MHPSIAAARQVQAAESVAESLKLLAARLDGIEAVEAKVVEQLAALDARITAALDAKAAKAK